MPDKRAMIICPRCLHRNSDAASACERCGGPLAPDWLSWQTGAPVRSSQGAAAAPRTQRPSVLSRPEPPSGQQGAIRLRIRLDAGKVIELAGKSRYLIGRYDERNDLMPDVDLTDSNGAASGVSRQHAALHVVIGEVSIEDLGSRNETMRNGSRLVKGQRYTLKDGDRIELGTIGLTIMIS